MDISEVVSETITKNVPMERSAYVEKYKKNIECDFCKRIAS